MNFRSAICTEFKLQKAHSLSFGEGWSEVIKVTGLLLYPVSPPSNPPHWQMGLLPCVDILCAKEYNPNEKADFVFSKDYPKGVLAEQLRKAVRSYYQRNNPKKKEYEVLEEKF